MTDEAKVEQVTPVAPEAAAPETVAEPAKKETTVEKLDDVKAEVADVKTKLEKFEDELKEDVKKVEDKIEKIEEKVVEEFSEAKKWFLAKFAQEDAEAAKAATEVPVVEEEPAPVAESDAPVQTDKKEGE